MRITFVLPMYLSTPSGGFKVVYEYANNLQARGHRVTVLHPRTLEPAIRPAERAKCYFWPYKLRLRDHRLVPWFELRKEVQVKLVPDLREDFIPAGDVIVATGYRTAFWVNRYPADRGQKYYLIQSYETWCGEEEEVNSSWVLPIRKIVIAKWLLGLAEKLGEGERTTYIPNGLDFSQFKVTIPITNRPLKVSMLAHPLALKGTLDGLSALEQVRKLVPEIQAILFGTCPRPSVAPSWIEYKQQPTTKELLAIYNSCSLFLQPSWTEGWGLTAAEAMACGCALVTTDNLGVREFADDGHSALFSPIKSPCLLAQNMIKLLNNDGLRQKLALTGHEKIQEFTWERATTVLESLFLS